MNNHSHNIHFIAKWLKVRFQFMNTCNLQARCTNKTAYLFISKKFLFSKIILQHTSMYQVFACKISCVFSISTSLLFFWSYYISFDKNGYLTSLGSYKRSKKLSSTSISWHLVDLVMVSEVLQLACRPLKIKPKVLRNNQVPSNY